MRTTWLGLLTAVAVTVSACVAPETRPDLPSHTEAAVLQVRSEGGFAPVEYVLGRGPSYTLLANGRLIHQGPQIDIYPGPLLPNYQASQINDEQMNTVLELVDKIGLPGMQHEIDNSAADFIVDATTKVVTYWDGDGVHSYSVYALDIEPDLSNPKTKAFAELLVVLDQLAFSGDQRPYEGERVRVIAGFGFEPDILDVRDWPLEDTDFSDWETLPNQWMCKGYGHEIIGAFSDANEVTQWTHPDTMMDAPAFTLLVRPLHPGEPDCPSF